MVPQTVASNGRIVSWSVKHELVMMWNEVVLAVFVPSLSSPETNGGQG